jgi:hypothetical protein
MNILIKGELFFKKSEMKRKKQKKTHLKREDWRSGRGWWW